MSDNNAGPSASTAPALSSRAITLKVITTASLTLIVYICIGLPMAVLPGYVHTDLGFSSFMAGIAISVQYIGTLVSRPNAGRMADAIGAKRTVLYGLLCCGACGVLTVLAALVPHLPWLDLGLLLIGRLALGASESLIATGAIMWGIGRMGAKHTARIISWNGIGTYGGLALGAPIGVMIEHAFGFYAIGLVIVLLAAAGYVWARSKAPVPTVPGERMGYRQVFRHVLPYGLCLALGTAGFGAISTFVTLYFLSHQWTNPAFTLTAFGVAFIGSRLLFGESIARHGGYRVAMASFAVEAVGLFLLGWASSPTVAMVGAVVVGLGFGMVFPSLAMVAVGQVAPSNRGSTLGIFSVFLDVALGAVGPLAGLVVGLYGYDAIFVMCGVASIVALAMITALYRKTRPTAA